jgi:hypothetical protein
MKMSLLTMSLLTELNEFLEFYNDAAPTAKEKSGRPKAGKRKRGASLILRESEKSADDSRFCSGLSAVLWQKIPVFLLSLFNYSGLVSNLRNGFAIRRLVRLRQGFGGRDGVSPYPALDPRPSTRCALAQ